MEDTGADLTVKSFFEEIENYMGLHHQAKDAKKELLTIKMENNENVSEYYHRIFKLWQRAKTPMEDRIEKFLTTLKPGISSSLIGKDYTDFKELLETARRIEARRKDVAHTFPRGDNKSEKSSTGVNRNQSRSAAPSQNSNSGSVRKTASSSQNTSESSNGKFGPVSQKPNGWVGEWFDGEKNPPKLQPEDKERLIKQNRCWSCRGSGHKGSDSVCINYDRKKKLNKLGVANSDKSESESDSGSEKE